MRLPRKFIFLAMVHIQWLFSLPDTSIAMANGFTTVVEAGKMNCFYDELDANKTLEVEYQVIEGGGEMDITFQVVSPNGAMLVNDEKRSDEVHTITTLDSGIYSFCFDNSFSRLAQKVVYVDLDLADAYSDEEDAWLKTLGEPEIQEKDLHIESIRLTLDNIRDQLEKAQQHQNYLTKKNFRNHFLVTRSSSRVFWWSLIQSIALIGVAICQVLIVKNFFATGSSTNQRI